VKLLIKLISFNLPYETWPRSKPYALLFRLFYSQQPCRSTCILSCWILRPQI